MNDVSPKPRSRRRSRCAARARRARRRKAASSRSLNYGRGREGLIPLWAGEGDLPTPAFICEAATRALAAGETFYTWQRGIPELREALARYHTRSTAATFAPEEFYVTGSGMQAIQIALGMVAGAGDEVVIPTPTWPNAAAAAGILGARAVEVPMSFRQRRLVARSRPARRRDHAEDARAVHRVAVSNPTGWTATRRGPRRAACARAPAWPLDHRRRDLCALLVRRGRARAVLLRRDGRRRTASCSSTRSPRTGR